MSETLRPCPFKHVPPQSLSRGPVIVDTIMVAVECGCGAQGPVCNTTEEAIVAWNTRPKDAMVVALKALVAVDDGIGPEDNYETAAQTVNDLDAAMNRARAVLKQAGALK